MSGCGFLLFCYSLQFFGCFLPQNALKLVILGKLNFYRLLMWVFIGWTAFKSIYLYCNEDPEKETNFPITDLWIGFMAAYLENFISVKWYDRGVVQYTAHIPDYLKIIWGVILGSLFLRWLILVVRGGKGGKIRRVSQVFKNK